MSGRFLLIIMVLAAVAGGWYFMQPKGQMPGGGPAGGMPTPSVEVIPAFSKTLYDRVEVLGDARANESVEISANVSERIDEIKFTDGQYVLKGETIALLAQAEERALLKAAELQLEQHERELGRLSALLKNKAVSKRDYEERQTQRDIAFQAIEEIQARIADRTLKAPFDGVLGIRQVSVGALIQAGQVITTIDDIHTIKLDFSVPSVFLPSLKPEMPIKAQVEALDNEVFDGQIETVNTRVDTVTRSVLVRAMIPNPMLKIKPGLLMKVTLLRHEREAIVVPEEAMIQRHHAFFVMVVKEDSSVEQREVGVGAHYAGVMEIREGLAAGEKVVVRGVHMVRPGVTVKVNKIWDEIRAPQPGDLRNR